MFRIRSKKRYEQRYLQHLLKGETSECAADNAMTETKKEMRAILDADTSLSQSRKDRLWSITYDELLDWQLLLKDLPQLSCEACRKKISETLKKIEDSTELFDGILSGIDSGL